MSAFESIWRCYYRESFKFYRHKHKVCICPLYAYMQSLFFWALTILHCLQIEGLLHLACSMFICTALSTAFAQFTSVNISASHFAISHSIQIFFIITIITIGLAIFVIVFAERLLITEVSPEVTFLTRKLSKSNVYINFFLDIMLLHTIDYTKV